MSALVHDFLIGLRNVVRQRRRSAVGILAVGSGVAMMLLASGFIEWMFFGMREWTIQTRLGHIQVMRPGYLRSGSADPFAYLLAPRSPALAKIADAPNVAIVGSRLSFNGLISRGESTISFIGEGVEPDKEHLLSRTLIINKGNDLSIRDPSGIIVGQGLAANLGLAVGDKVVLMANTASGGVNAMEGVVRGFFATVSKAYDDAALRMPIEAARTLLRVQGSHVWVVLLKQTEQTDDTLASLRAALRGDALDLVPWYALADLYNKTVALFSRQVAVLKGIIALIIILSIANTMMMSVTERTGEIGTSMALGVTRARILRMFLAEGALLGVFGGLLGLAVGYVLARLISAIGIPMPPPPGMARGYIAEIAMTWAMAREALALAVGSTLLASLYPAWKASRMVIVDALRHNR